jgi:hypothetical protein
VSLANILTKKNTAVDAAVKGKVTMGLTMGEFKEQKEGV